MRRSRSAALSTVSLMCGGALFLTSDDADACQGVGFGTSDQCQVSVHCIEHRPEMRATGKVVGPNDLFATVAGSGTLINDSQNSGRLFFLTALHLFDQNNDLIVGDGEANDFALQMQVTFGAYEETCAGEIVEGPIKSIQGANILGIDEATDQVLLELDGTLEEILDAGVSPYFVGWDPFVEFVEFGHLLHHPCCDAKMVTGVQDAPSEVHPDFDGFFYVAPELLCGGVEPGSSGGGFYHTPDRVLAGTFNYFDLDGSVFIDGLACPNQPTTTLYGRYLGIQTNITGLGPIEPFDPMGDGGDPQYVRLFDPEKTSRSVWAAKEVILAPGFAAPRGTEFAVEAGPKSPVAITRNDATAREQIHPREFAGAPNGPRVALR